jgi:hypothetical protein
MALCPRPIEHDHTRAGGGWPLSAAWHSVVRCLDESFEPKTCREASMIGTWSGHANTLLILLAVISTVVLSIPILVASLR